uniref:Uncharacterized protein n=1 Tax=Romanomermis culicivorax TaxID=13658 RepID=A0A915JW57_ROMCU
MTIDVDALGLVFWKGASVQFKNWWGSQHGEQYLTRTKPFWGFMKQLCQMFQNHMLDDEQLASHLWNILQPGARALWMGAHKKYIHTHLRLEAASAMVVIVYNCILIYVKELVVDEDSENITSKDEEEEEEEKTLDNNNIWNEKGTILDYDDDENNQYKSYSPHSSNEEEIYEPVQFGGGVCAAA